ncbi:MAG: sigma 54-interacting transcriptional regulator [Methylococcales bacterium]|nr:sigma 54-interacting transcriptional regulator [Methylococcales bacterium]MBT7443528.1 sigma 54-interacting transcriptional regulator [Methylococcales bacterium]
MDFSFFAALALGFFSTVHCIGMCGGIMGALSYGQVNSRRKKMALLLSYNLGRITSYSIAGALVASFGHAILAKISPENGLIILQSLAGLMMISIGLYLSGWFPKFVAIETLGHKIWPHIEPFGSRLLPVTSSPVAFVFGLIWGWLPCGIVYSMLITSASLGSAWTGFWYMAGFGLGTLPTLFLTGVMAGQFFHWSRQERVRQGMGLFVIILAIFYIYQSLGMAMNTSHQHHEMVGQSPQFQQVLATARIVAKTEATVLVLGKSGTGKEQVAHLIHEQSYRNIAPFVAVNCAAIPENLVESELFGHVKGAFTGAIKDHVGFVAEANGGTLLLDEVGELPLALQAKLLRLIENKTYTHVGSTKVHNANIRIIAATNQDLSEAVKAGTFREDLFYRLNVVPIQLPALSERTGDVPGLISHYLALFSKQYQVALPKLDKAAMKQLKAYNWPGNIRELRNLCERLVILTPGTTVAVENLPHEFTLSESTHAFSLPSAGVDLQRLEQDFLQQALARTSGNKSRAAKLLGLTRDTFLYRLKKYAIG